MTNKELLAIVVFLNQFQVVLFEYEINVFSYHKNMFYSATLSESQRVMCCRLILKDFEPNIQHIYGVDKKVSDMLSILPSAYFDKHKPRKIKAQCRANKFFAISRLGNKNIVSH